VSGCSTIYQPYIIISDRSGKGSNKEVILPWLVCRRFLPWRRLLFCSCSFESSLSLSFILSTVNNIVSWFATSKTLPFSFLELGVLLWSEILFISVLIPFLLLPSFGDKGYAFFFLFWKHGIFPCFTLYIRSPVRWEACHCSQYHFSIGNGFSY